MSVPRVTVGLPVHNGERHLAEAVESLLVQTFSDFELVISDNASTDATEDICRRYAAADPRIRYERSDRNRGASWNFNRVFELGRGEYFKWASHDDVCRPELLERCVGALDAAPEVVLCYPRTLLIDDDGALVGPYVDGLDLRQAEPHARLRTFLERIDLANPIFGLVRRDVMSETRLVRPFQASDLVLLAELVMRGHMLEVPEPLMLRRVHAGMSRRANTTPREVAAWFDPVRARRLLRFPLTRLVAEYARAIARAPLPGAERARALAVLARTWTSRQMGRVVARLTGRASTPAWTSKVTALSVPNRVPDRLTLHGPSGPRRAPGAGEGSSPESLGFRGQWATRAGAAPAEVQERS